MNLRPQEEISGDKYSIPGIGSQDLYVYIYIYIRMYVIRSVTPLTDFGMVGSRKNLLWY